MDTTKALDPKALEAARIAAHSKCPSMEKTIRAYLSALSPSVIGSDTAGLPSDRAGLVEWLEEVTSCGCIEPERFDEAAEAIAALSASPPQGDDAARLDWLEAHPAAEVVRREQEWPDNVQWEVCEIHGGRNDREWHVRGVGETVRDALDAAMLAARPVQGGSDE